MLSRQAEKRHSNPMVVLRAEALEEGDQPIEGVLASLRMPVSPEGEQLVAEAMHTAGCHITE